MSFHDVLLVFLFFANVPRFRMTIIDPCQYHYN